VVIIQLIISQNLGLTPELKNYTGYLVIVRVQNLGYADQSKNLSNQLHQQLATPQPRNHDYESTIRCKDDIPIYNDDDNNDDLRATILDMAFFDWKH
jgi:hypothetical protein